MSTRFLILKNILAELKRKNSITVLEEHCQEKWEVYDLLMDLTNDENFKQAYIDLSFNKSFKKNFIELANQAKKAVTKYFRDKDIDLRAFYVETNNSDKVLNINLINYNRSEPIRISDILQQERNISTLNIYCDKKHDIYAYRKGKERHYEFKEDAYYEMTSTWTVQDKDGKTFTCTMVMNVSSSGITEVLQFNGKDFKSPPEEFWNLIRQNEELYIQDLSLHDAVKALLEKNKNTPAVSNLQNNEHIVINQDEKLKDLENDAKNNPILSFISNNISTQTEINPQQITTQAIATQTEIAPQQAKTQTKVDLQEAAIQTGISLQHTKTQTEIAMQHIETQTEIAFQQAEAQNLQEVATQIEVNLQHIETQAEVTVQHAETQTGIGSQETETQTEVNLQEAAVQTEVNSQQLDQNLTKAEQEIRELNELRNNLQHRLDEAEQKIRELNEQRNELRYRFDKAEQELEKLEKHNSDLQNELGEEKQEIRELNELRNNLQYRLDEAEQKIRELNERRNKLQYSFEEAGQKNVKLEKHSSKLQRELEGEKQKNAKLQTELTQKDEKLANISTELQERAQELEGAYKEKQDLKKKLETASEEQKKLKGEVYQLKEDANANEEEVNSMRSKHDKSLKDSKSETKDLENKYNAHLEFCEQQIDQLEYKNEELTNELELKDEQLEKIREQLQQKVKNERLMNFKSQMQNLQSEHNAHLEPNEQEECELEWDKSDLTPETEDQQIETMILQLQQKIVEDNKCYAEIEILKEKIKDQAMEIERITEEREKLNGKEPYLNNQDAERKSRSSSSDSAFYSDDDCCNSLLNLTSGPSKVCNQSQCANV